MKSHWNERFAREAYLYGKDPNQFIKGIEAVLLPKGRLLAIAEGEGRNAFYIAESAKNAGRDLTIDLWDYSDVELRKVNERKGNLAITTKEVDLTETMWEESQYDAAFCVYGHFSKALQAHVFQGLRKTLKPGGWLFGEVYSDEQIPYGSGGPRNVDYLYSPAHFLEVFAGDFFKHFYVGEVMREEGDLHKGLCHVIQFAIQIRK